MQIIEAVSAIVLLIVGALCLFVDDYQAGAFFFTASYLINSQLALRQEKIKQYVHKILLAERDKQ